VQREVTWVFFPLGKVVATPGALEALQRNLQRPIEFLARHIRGDWGDVPYEDKLANRRALLDGSRIFSAYSLRDGTRIWCITEADRSSTCLLLPDEY